MASEIGVQKLMHTNATQAATINSSGRFTMDDGYQADGAVDLQIKQALLKMWCSWSMNDTGNPYDSFNLSSITDNTATQNTMTYTNAFNTANGQCVNTATNANSANVSSYSSSDLQIHTPTTTSVKIQSQSNNNPAFNGMQVTGDLA